MAVKTREEILDTFRTRVGEQPDDETLSFLEDVSDTLTDLENRANEDWKSKYEENDREWRKKYTERFFSTGTKSESETEPEPEPEPEKPKKFEDLFKVKEN